VIGTDIAFEERFLHLGYNIKRYDKLNNDHVVGIHALRSHTPGMLYSKFSDRSRKNPETVEAHVRFFDAKLRESGDPKYAAAMIGTLNPRSTSGERNRQIEMRDPVRRFIDNLAFPEELIDVAISKDHIMRFLLTVKTKGNE
jgi:hypothetical protein